MSRALVIVCPQCGTPAQKRAQDVNRAKRAGMRIFCSRVCSGLARRLVSPPTPEQKKAAKAAYDREYRMRDVAARRAKKAAYFQRTYDPAKARKVRAARMHLHIEYCRQPAYRQWKREYDKRYLANKNYGPFADAFLALVEVENEVASQATRHEIYAMNGTLNKAQARRRAMQ